MENFINVEFLDAHEMIPGFNAKFVHSESMTISYWEIKKGSTLPEHAHPHEQISQVMEGLFELTIAGTSQIMKPGMVAIIPSNIIHSGKALTDSKVMDIFCPVRKDYMIK
jgi:quercetin dioxygenase-like cupin family protein